MAHRQPPAGKRQIVLKIVKTGPIKLSRWTPPAHASSSAPITAMIFSPSFLKDIRVRFAARSLSNRMRDVNGDPAAQVRCLDQLLKGLACTDYGKAHDLRAGLGAGDFARLVPIQDLRQTAHLVERLRTGMEHLLWPGRTCAFSNTPGFPWMPQHEVPITEDFLADFNQAWEETLLLTQGKGAEASLLRSPWVCVGLPNAGTGLRLNGVPGLLSLCDGGLPPPRHVGTEEIFQTGGLAAWLSLPEQANVRLLVVGDPLWLASLASEPLPPERPLWVLTWSPCLASLEAQLERVLGPQVRLHELLATDLGVLAVRDADLRSGMRLLSNHGAYFEFIPLDDYLRAQREKRALHAIPLSQVKQGSEYVLLVSNRSGLCRHDTGEILRFTSLNPSRVEPCGQVSHVFASERLMYTERVVMEALAGVCDRNQWTIVHAHVAPLLSTKPGFAAAPASEWWVELRPGSHATPTGPLLSEGLDVELRKLLPTYASLRDKGGLAAPLVRLVIPGVFSRFIRDAGREDGFCRLPRCLPDRRMADVLAGLARFSD